MSFETLNLHPKISKAIQACGYTQPTPIQKEAIPVILSGKDLMACAPTGTGKTGAFVLPALHHLNQQVATKRVRILILTPTRELANQITKAATLYGKFSHFNIISLVGGMPYHHQIKDLARGADIVVATPGRLLDHLENQRINLSQVDMLILDEADRMLDMGFIDDVQQITKLTPATRQTLLFSATLDNRLLKIVRHIMKDPVRIDLSNQQVTSPQIKQELYKAKNNHHKVRLLTHFLNDTNIFKAIIFSATKINADQLAYELRDQGFSAAALHGDLKQNVRNRTIDQLRSGKIQFLVATDVAARGIDINDVTHVINYDLPKFCEDYVHRIGRTGRAGKLGTAISFVLPSDARHVQRIERFLGTRLKLMQDVVLTDTGNASSRVPQQHPHSTEKFDVKRKPRFQDHKEFAHKHANKDRFGDRKNDYSYSKDSKEGYKKKANDNYRKDKPHSQSRHHHAPAKNDDGRGEGFKQRRSEDGREGFKRSEDGREGFKQRRSEDGREGFKRSEDGRPHFKKKFNFKKKSERKFEKTNESFDRKFSKKKTGIQ